MRLPRAHPLLQTRLPLLSRRTPPALAVSTTTTTTPTLSSPRHRRNITTSPSILNPNDPDKKSSLMDRDSINTESNEYSKTGSDDSAAGHKDPAFQPGNNDPESQLKESGPGDGRDPLKVSPANHEVSQPKMDTERGAQKGPDRTETSGRGSGPKEVRMRAVYKDMGILSYGSAGPYRFRRGSADLEYCWSW
ncbi:hypothetical protein GJ744_005310 [Endocarpon pusillum]|uniref:Uncharacterized protein n=1 Tax=Endocarpon pusillum TaxID=364733 RepID=A0A8H7AMW0_9EURO|nr:hypothetical protein GJ744_005310 [Endocarpon pusillum]